MKILLITSADIYRKSGGGLANRAFYDSLVLHYPGLVDVLQYEEAVHYCMDSNFYHLPKFSKIEKAIYLLTGKIHRLYPWLDSFLSQNKGKYKMCIVNSGLFGDIVPRLKAHNIKTVLIHHNYEPDYQKDNKQPVAYWGLNNSLVKRNEKIGYINADINLFLSKNDLKKMTSVYGVSKSLCNEVVGIYETRESQPLPDYCEQSYLDVSKLCICGSLSDVQTADAIAKFMANYFKLIPDVLGTHFSLTITGRNPGIRIRQYADQYSNVHIVPNPNDISEIVKECGILLCPIDRGSGIKLRIMDGLKLGMPILAHSVSAQGYEEFYGFPWFQVYDDEQSFIVSLKNIINTVINNPGLKSEIINAYNSFFSFINGDKRFYSCLKKIWI